MADVTLTSAMRNNLSQLRMTSQLMDATQNRIATGNKVNSALDDPTAFFKAKGLKDDASDLSVLKDNMGQTISSIQAADKAITSITSLVEQAKSLAISAKAETSSTERASLAAQFNDIRSQIDTLSADASYGGQNLVSGRGVITGGAFTDTSATAVTSLSGVATGGIARTGTDTDIATYTFATDQKVNALSTSVTLGASNGTSKIGEVFLNGTSVGTVTASGTAATDATAIAALSTEISASTDTLTVTDGNVLEIRDSGAAGFVAGATSLAQAGLQNDATGATVVDLTSDLGIYGAEIYAHVSGYTDNTSTDVTFAVSGTTLTVTDGTGSSSTIDTSVFAAAGTDSLAIGDLTVNFVTSTAAENTNDAVTITQSVAPVAQVGTVTFAGTGTTFATGDEYSVTVNGSTYSTVQAGAGGTSTAFAVEWLAENVTAGILNNDASVGVTHAAGLLTFTAVTAGNSFTLAANEITDSLGDSAVSVTVPTTANTSQANTFTVTGSIDDGDVFTTTVNGTAISYTATATDTTITTIATGLAAAVNSNTTLINGTSGILASATSLNGVVTMTENGNGATMTLTAAATDASITLGNASSTSSTQTLKSLTTGTADGDMRIKVTSGSTTETVDVSTTSTTAATISNANFGSTFTFTADDATMVTGESVSLSVANATGTGANDAQVVFNTDGTSTINVQAVDTTASGLSISAAAGGWATDANADAAITELDAAKTTLRSNSKTMATSLGVIQTRETFTENFIDNLRVGADKLTLADGSEEATNMLMLQTRQQLGIQALSMASQSSQSILSLFR